MRASVRLAVTVLAGAAPLVAQAQTAPCGIAPATLSALQTQILAVTQLADANGGLFKPNRVFGAIVDRAGKLCYVGNFNADPWPGTRANAVALAETANGYSNLGLAISTANLYAPSQPGGFFAGLAGGSPMNPAINKPVVPANDYPGGYLAIGGGVALYSGGQVVGGLGIAGDTSCADHAVAYRARRAVGLDGIPGGATSNGTDNIEYGSAPLTGFQHPHCLATDIVP